MVQVPGIMRRFARTQFFRARDSFDYPGPIANEASPSYVHIGFPFDSIARGVHPPRSFINGSHGRLLAITASHGLLSVSPQFSIRNFERAIGDGIEIHRV